MLKDSIKIILIINYKYCKFIKKLKKKFLFNYIILKFLFNFIILKFLFNFIYLIKKNGINLYLLNDKTFKKNLIYIF